MKPHFFYYFPLPSRQSIARPEENPPPTLNLRTTYIFSFPPIKSLAFLPLSQKAENPIAKLFYWLSICLTLLYFTFTSLPTNALAEPKQAPTPSLAEWLALSSNQHASKHLRNPIFYLKLPKFHFPVTYPTEDRLQPRSRNKATYRIAD